MLEECKRSVEAQTERSFEHLVYLDEERRGCAVTMNRLAGAAQGEWVLPLADDDLLFPRTLEILLEHSEGADVVWSRPVVWGNDDAAHITGGEPPYIPSFALVRRLLWHELGGYDERLTREEDRSLWRRALDAGAAFRLVEDGPTWLYRFSFNSDGRPRNKSYNRGVAS